jgi:hypothetical protein
MMSYFKTLLSLFCLCATTVAAQAQPVTDFTIADEDLPMYSFGRVSMAVPTTADDHVATIGAGFGMQFSPTKQSGAGNNVGLRLIWVPDGPRNPLDSEAIDIGSSWGTVVDWQHVFSPARRMSFYTNVGFGFMYGEPTEAERGNYPDKNLTNVVIPILEGGLGLRVLTRALSEGGARVFFAPEIGFVPGINAPYAALNFGLL